MSQPDRTLHHRVDGDGEPVLLLHSVGLDLTFWEAVAGALAPEYRVVRVDLRGHGRSPHTGSPWRMSDIADDVHLLLDSLRVGPVHLVGQSFGGLVAQALVLDHPGDVRSLVLSGTSCTTSPAEREIFLGRATTAERGGMAAVTVAAIDRWFTAGFMDAPMVTRVRERLLADDVGGWAATFRAIAEHNTFDRLRSVRVPTLVTTGDADVATPPAMSRELADAIPGARLHIMPGAPHMGPLERPDLFVPLLGDFLRSLP
ncbi:alpha/beta fold hydrolase [Jiangella asiatica]|uniref:Alpha/beta fold hydrolase n=1 Tax=Jiangella asiatica TaxID=2530372 RepID=A0A4R5DIP5_9ACTN|nr:alpha/beta fold hydrolase [Jiangella asiatica]TDE11821.1 alpha/beta fold hydrolase [Jiangella asiatica]